MNYQEAGVDTAAKAEALAGVGEAVRSTYTPEVLLGIGAFGGGYAANRIKAMREPVLVASTDGVGTKVMLALELGRPEGLGWDLVHHSVNDVLAQGALPLFFLDYVAAAKLEPQTLTALINSVAAACRNLGIPLLGGESAEMPGVYREQSWDLAGTLVGVVERSRVINGVGVRPGDLIHALPANGPHTNGYSLIRRIVAGKDLNAAPPELAGLSLAEALLAPHRCYLPEVGAWQEAGLELKALAHITGGGIYENLPRVLPAGCGALIKPLEVPYIFSWLAEAGGLANTEMYRVFNMGLGYLAITSVGINLPGATVVGEVVAGSGVRLEGID